MLTMGALQTRHSWMKLPIVDRPSQCVVLTHIFKMALLKRESETRKMQLELSFATPNAGGPRQLNSPYGHTLYAMQTMCTPLCQAKGRNSHHWKSFQTHLLNLTSLIIMPWAALFMHWTPNCKMAGRFQNGLCAPALDYTLDHHHAMHPVSHWYSTLIPALFLPNSIATMMITLKQ